MILTVAILGVYAALGWMYAYADKPGRHRRGKRVWGGGGRHRAHKQTHWIVWVTKEMANA